MCLHVFIRSFIKGIYIVKKWEGVWHGVDADQSWNSIKFWLFLSIFCFCFCCCWNWKHVWKNSKTWTILLLLLVILRAGIGWKLKFNSIFILHQGMSQFEFSAPIYKSMVYENSYRVLVKKLKPNKSKLSQNLLRNSFLLLVLFYRSIIYGNIINHSKQWYVIHHQPFNTIQNHFMKVVWERSWC